MHSSRLEISFHVKGISQVRCVTHAASCITHEISDTSAKVCVSVGHYDLGESLLQWLMGMDVMAPCSAVAESVSPLKDSYIVHRESSGSQHWATIAVKATLPSVLKDQSQADYSPPPAYHLCMLL